MNLETSDIIVSDSQDVETTIDVNINLSKLYTTKT